MRARARNSLTRAVKLLEAADEVSVRYACLELRMCIEFLIFDRAQGYVQYLDDDVSTKWTPRQVLTELLNADPHADETVAVAIAAEVEPGKPTGDWKQLGEDRRFKLKWANSNWNALGSYLHAPTLQQLKDGPPSHEEMSKKARAIADHLTHVLAAPIHNVVGGGIFVVQCRECDKVTKRLADGVRRQGSFVCRNPACRAVYDVVENGAEARFRLRMVDVTCPKCDAVAPFKAHDVVPGRTLVCDGCRAKLRVIEGIGVDLHDPTDIKRNARPNSSESAPHAGINEADPVDLLTEHCESPSPIRHSRSTPRRP